MALPGTYSTGVGRISTPSALSEARTTPTQPISTSAATSAAQKTPTKPISTSAATSAAKKTPTKPISTKAATKAARKSSKVGRKSTKQALKAARKSTKQELKAARKSSKLAKKAASKAPLGGAIGQPGKPLSGSRTLNTRGFNQGEFLTPSTPQSRVAASRASVRAGAGGTLRTPNRRSTAAPSGAASGLFPVTAPGESTVLAKDRWKLPPSAGTRIRSTVEQGGISLGRVTIRPNYRSGGPFPGSGPGFGRTGNIRSIGFSGTF